MFAMIFCHMLFWWTDSFWSSLLEERFEVRSVTDNRDSVDVYRNKGWWQTFIIFPDKKKEITYEKREIETPVHFIDSKTGYSRMVLKSPFTEFLFNKEINNLFFQVWFLWELPGGIGWKERCWEDHMSSGHASQIGQYFFWWLGPGGIAVFNKTE